MRFVKRLALLVGSVFAHDTSPKVVFYHDIGQKWTPMGTPVDLFLAHMKYLRKGDVVCFDDGFRGIWDERDLLGRVKCVIVFVAVELVGRPGYLTWDEIRELQNKYGIAFQCHTWSHQTLAGPWNVEVVEPKEGRTEEWYKHELVDSKAELERMLCKKVTALCFPVGYFSDKVISRCKAAGYEKVYASYPGNVTGDYVQPRCLVQHMSAGEFKSVLKGAMNLFRWHYFMRHKVDRRR